MGIRHKTLYVMRHGQTSSNVDGRFQGSEGPLTTLGREQASRLGEHLRKHKVAYPITTLVTSTHRRAQETAERIGEACNLKIISTPLFVERKHPEIIHGKLTTDPQARAIWEEGRKRFHDDAFTYADGETFEDVKARALAALEFALALPDTHIGVVTHGAFATVLAAVSLRGVTLTSHDLNAYQLRLANTGLSILGYETRANFSEVSDGWVMHRWNDTAHLLL